MKKLIVGLLALMLGVFVLVSATAEGSAQQGIISAVTVAGNQVTVVWSGESAARVALEVYNDDETALIAQRTLPAGSASNETTVFSFDSLPADGFALKAQLLDENGAQLGEAFWQRRYTSEVRALLRMKPEDFSSQRTLPLSASKYASGSFLALNENVTLIQTGGGVTVQPSDDGSSFSVSAGNSALRAQLSALQPGAILLIADGDAYSVLRLQSFTQSGENFVLYASPNQPFLDECFDACMLENLEKSFHYETDVSFLNLSFGSVTATLVLDVQTTLAVNAKRMSAYLSTVIDYRLDEVKVTITSPTASVEKTILAIPLGPDIPGLAGVEMDVNLVLEATGAGSLVFETGGRLGLEAGFSLKRGPYVANRSTLPTVAFNGLEVEGEIFAGLSAGPAFQFFKILTLSASVSGGVAATGRLNTIAYADQKQKWHACESMKCLEGDFKARVSSAISLSAGHFGRAHSTTLYESPPLGYWYHSFTFGDGHMTRCPHYGYRLKLRVVNQNGAPLPNAKVSYSPISKRFDSQAKGATDASGSFIMYIPLTQTSDPNKLAPTPVTLTAEYTDRYGHRFLVKQPFEEKGYKEETLADPEAVIQVDTTRYSVLFDENGTGKTANMPANFYIYKADGSKVNLPDNVPEKSGRLFLGWSRSPDAERADYAPGGAIEITGDTRLYAVWQLSGGNRYLVLYNANGGENAPPAQLAFLTEDLVLSSDTPTWQGGTFLGWSSDKYAAEPNPAYAPGSLYTGRKTLTLYAVWQYHPVLAACITYHANGDSAGPLPKPQWVSAGSWVRLGDETPLWDQQHRFLGWDENASAALPSYGPGAYAYISDDTALYAVWDICYRIVEGADSRWTRGSAAQLRFVADGNPAYFRQVLVDGKAVASSQYEVFSGSSTDLRLHADYLQGLCAGRHTLQMIYRDGSTQEAAFFIDQVPQTGDDSPVEGIVAWLLLSGVSLLLLLRRLRRAALS